MIWHGFALTHLDALCHAFAGPDVMYNRFPVDHVTPQGATKLGIEVIAEQEVCGRGVLLDIAAHHVCVGRQRCTALQSPFLVYPC